MNLIIMILLISLLILVHEAGHFLVAKLFGVKVEKFGFGLPFGPTLFKKQIGETEFLVHSFLLGGYVSFPDDEETSELPCDSPRRFKNKPVWQRAMVVLAGVFSNLVFAIILVAFVGALWGNLPANKFEISVLKILPNATVSTKESGLKAGDIIYSVNGSKSDLPMVLTKYLLKSKTRDGFVDPILAKKKLKQLKKINPGIKTDEKIAKNTLVKLPSFEDEKTMKYTDDEILGFEQYKNTEQELSEVQKKLRNELINKTAYKVKNGVTLNDIAYAASDTVKPVQIVVLRDGKQVKIKNIYPNEDGFMGIEKGVRELHVPTKNPKDLFVNTMRYTAYNLDLMVYGLGKILTGKIPLKEMHGIVAITKIGSDVIEYQGLYKGLLLTAIISLNLAVINLLPIPALDGGHMFFLIVEQIRGRALNEKVTEAIGNFFFYLLIILMILIIFNDVFALITKKI